MSNLIQKVRLLMLDLHHKLKSVHKIKEKIMKSKNKFTLFGRVCWKSELKNTMKGKKLIIINIGEKIGENKYNNFFITFFDNENSNNATVVEKNINVNNYIQVDGYLSSFKKADEEKKTHLQLVGKGYTKFNYNTGTNCWEEVESSTIETSDMGETADLY